MEDPVYYNENNAPGGFAFCLLKQRVGQMYGNWPGHQARNYRLLSKGSLKDTWTCTNDCYQVGQLA